MGKKFILSIYLLISISILGVDAQVVNIALNPFALENNRREGNIYLYSRPEEITFNGSEEIKILDNSFEEVDGVEVTYSRKLGDNTLQLGIDTLNGIPGTYHILIEKGDDQFISYNSIRVKGTPFEISENELSPDVDKTIIVTFENSVSISEIEVVPSDGIRIKSKSFSGNRVTISLGFDNPPLGFKTLIIGDEKLEKAFYIGEIAQGGFSPEIDLSSGSGSYSEVTFKTPVMLSPFAGEVELSVYPEDGITISNVNVVNSYTLTFDMSLNSVSDGEKTFQIKSAGKKLFIDNIFKVGEDTAYNLLSISPEFIEQGSETWFILNFDKLPTGTPTIVSNDSKITFSNITVEENKIKSVISIPTDVSTGRKDITLNFGSETIQLDDAITIIEQSYSVTPKEVTQGETVSLTFKSLYSKFNETTYVEIEGLTIDKPEITSEVSQFTISDIIIPEDIIVGPKKVKFYQNDKLIYSMDNFTIKQGENTKILSISPNDFDQGIKNYQVTITGQNTHFSENSIITNSDGTISGSIIVATDEVLMALINISSDAAVGNIPLQIKTDYEDVILEDAIEIKERKNIVSAEPSLLELGDNDITFTLSSEIEDDNFTIWISGSGITVKNMERVDGTTITATLEVTTNGGGAVRDVAIIQDRSVFYGKEIIDPVVPTILSISPKVLQPGGSYEMIILGEDTNFSLNTQVIFEPSNVIVQSGPPQAISNVELHINVNVAEDAEEESEYKITIQDQDLVLNSPSDITVKTLPKTESSDSGCSFRRGAHKAGALPFGLLVMLFLGVLYFKKHKF